MGERKGFYNLLGIMAAIGIFTTTIAFTGLCRTALDEQRTRMVENGPKTKLPLASEGAAPWLRGSRGRHS